MIEAKPHPLALWLFDRYITRLLRKSFRSFQIFGKIPSIDPNLPLLLLPNHSSWWDGFFIYMLNREFFKRPLKMMMLEEQLRRFWFFSRVGAYSIQPGHQKSILDTFKYTVELLHDSEIPQTICIYPQGELQPWSKRPIEFRPGVREIIKRTETRVQIMLVGMRIEYLDGQHADVYFHLSPVRIVNANALPDMAALAVEMESLLSVINENVLSEKSGKIIFDGSGR